METVLQDRSTALDAKRERRFHNGELKEVRIAGNTGLPLDTEFRSISWCRVPSTFFAQNAIRYVESVDYKTVRISSNGKQLFFRWTGSCRIPDGFLQITCEWSADIDDSAISFKRTSISFFCDTCFGPQITRLYILLLGKCNSNRLCYIINNNNNIRELTSFFYFLRNMN